MTGKFKDEICANVAFELEVFGAVQVGCLGLFAKSCKVVSALMIDFNYFV